MSKQSYKVTIELLNEIYGEEKEGADESPIFNYTSALQERIDVVYDRVDEFYAAPKDVARAAKRVEIKKAVDALKAFYERVDPVKVKERNWIEKLYDAMVMPYYVKSEATDGYYRDFLTDEDLAEAEAQNDQDVEDGFARIIFTRNEPLSKDRRKPVIINRADVEVNYFGIPRCSIGATKRVRSYWIGKVYCENQNGRRGDSNLANTIAEYFGVSRRTVFYNAQYAASYDKAPAPYRQTVVIKAADEIPDGIRGDWTLKNLSVKVWIKPWENPDDYGGRKGITTRTGEAKDENLRSIPFDFFGVGVDAKSCT